MSEKGEDYLKVIYQICEDRGFAKSVEIAEALNVKPSSVSDMLKKLQSKGLVIYEKYRGIRLTTQGKDMARRLIYISETLKTFFEIFGVKEEEAGKVAHKIEHYIDEESFERIEKFVKFVKSFKDSPRWLEHFQEFVEYGKLPECNRRK